MRTRLSGGAKSVLLAYVAFLLLATSFGAGVAHGQASNTCIDGAPAGGFSFTCNFAITNFALTTTTTSAQPAPEFAMSLVPGFSCQANPSYLSLDCTGNAPAGQPVTGKIGLVSSSGQAVSGCVAYSGLVDIPRASNTMITSYWLGTLCDSGSFGGTALGARHRSICVVPQLVGQTLFEARLALRTAHCKLGKVTRIKVSPTNRYVVFSQSPAAGTLRFAGARIKVIAGR